MGARSAAGLVLAIASLALAGAARAEGDPLKDPAVARIRASFQVDGIALFDAHAVHAPRMGICAASVFAGLKWCVSGTAEEKKGEAAYVKTTGYNIDADNRIVYAISTRRGYPLKRAEFDGIVQAIGERYGAGATVLAFKKPSAETGGIDSLIAVWGGVRLVQLSEAEYALVEGGGSLKRGHLVDHRFNLVVSAKQREPVYKVEGEAGFILHLVATSPDRADVIARAVYPPVFQPAPGKPGPEADNPLVAESVRRAWKPASGEHKPNPMPGAAPDDRGKRVDAERGLAAERLLREEAERKAADEKAARGELERMAAEERRAFERERQRLEAARKAAEERAGRAESALKSSAERRSMDEAARKRSDDAARRKDDAERKAADEAARRDAAKQADERRAEEERKAAEERRGAEQKRADEQKPSPERKSVPPEADRKAESARPAPERADAAKPSGAIWSFSETQDRVADERTMRAQAVFGAAGNGGDGRLAVEVTFECTIIGRDRRLRAHARGFDRKSGSGVAFRTAGEDSFGVRARFTLDDQAPQSGLLFREHQDDTASILEIPVTAADLGKDAPRAAIWLRHKAVALEFPLAAGTVPATIAPQADNLRRVLEACAQ